MHLNSTPTQPCGHQSPPSNGAPNSPFRVLIYSRVNSPQQVQHGHSLEAQPEDLRAYAKVQGWRVGGEITDPGRSGRTAAREGYNSLMESLRVQHPDAVLITRLSRFMRNARLTLNAIDEMDQLGVALICKNEPIDTRHTGMGKMLLTILAAVAEFESDQLSQYAKETRRRLIAKGRWPGGPPPYGYQQDKATGYLTLDSKRVAVVRLIYSLYTTCRWSTIRSVVNRSGIISIFAVFPSQIQIETLRARASSYEKPKSAKIEFSSEDHNPHFDETQSCVDVGVPPESLVQMLFKHTFK